MAAPKAPKVYLLPKYALEDAEYHKVVFRDLQSGKTGKWPRIKPVEQYAWEQFLESIVDPDTGYFYPKRDEEGKPVKTTPDNIPKYAVISIIRLKRKDNSEYLLSKGNFIGHDGFGEPVRHYVPWPEKWEKTNFNYVKDFDPKRKTMVKNCTGPGLVETVYTMPFNQENLEKLFQSRENDNISWVVKDDITGVAKQVSGGSNINDTFKLFLKPFSYLYNAEYITPEMKAEYRQRAIDEGVLTAPSAAATVPQPSTPPKAGTYS